jgi:purine-binding chemotaxis protein CheW
MTALPPFLRFDLDGRSFGLPAADVIEIVRAVAITPLPRAPDVVEGIIDVRGRIVPVLDVRQRFRLPPKEVDLEDHLVIASVGERVIAIRVDRCEEILTFEGQALDDLERAVAGAGYVAGVMKRSDGLVLIHDLRTFLSNEETMALDEALA